MAILLNGFPHSAINVTFCTKYTVVFALLSSSKWYACFSQRTGIVFKDSTGVFQRNFEKEMRRRTKRRTRARAKATTSRRTLWVTTRVSFVPPVVEIAVVAHGGDIASDEEGAGAGASEESENGGVFYSPIANCSCAGSARSRSRSPHSYPYPCACACTCGAPFPCTCTSCFIRGGGAFLF